MKRIPFNNERINLLLLGGIGIEKKNFSDTKEIITMGGSSWHMALTSRGLGSNPYIMSIVGDDEEGQHVKESMKRINAGFVGLTKGKTQEFSSLIQNGIPIEFSAAIDNMNLTDTKECFSRLSIDYDILIIGYVQHEILPFIIQNESSKRHIRVLNMSSALLEIPHKFLTETMNAFDLVTMNEREAKYLELELSLSFTDLSKIVESPIFVTSISKIDLYHLGGQQEFYIEDLPNPIDSTGAGDAFATSLAISCYKKLSIDEAINQAVISAHSMCKIAEKDYIESGSWCLK